MKLVIELRSNDDSETLLSYGLGYVEEDFPPQEQVRALRYLLGAGALFTSALETALYAEFSRNPMLHINAETLRRLAETVSPRAS